MPDMRQRWARSEKLHRQKLVLLHHELLPLSSQGWPVVVVTKIVRLTGPSSLAAGGQAVLIVRSSCPVFEIGAPSNHEGIQLDGQLTPKPAVQLESNPPRPARKHTGAH